jgi:mRNA interferase MazF
MPATTTGRSSTALRRGDVVLVPFPFSDLSATKVRPAVVVSGSSYHCSEPDLILAAITSSLAAATGPFDYVRAA